MKKVNSSWVVPISSGTCAAPPAARVATGSTGNTGVPITGPLSVLAPIWTNHGGSRSFVAGSARRQAAAVAGSGQPTPAA